MEKQDLDKLVNRYLELKSKGSKIDRVLTYQLYNELMKPKRKGHIKIVLEWTVTPMLR